MALPTTFFSAFLCFIASSVLAAETAPYVKVPICKNGMAFEIPARPGLRVNGKYLSTNELDRENPNRIIWQRGDPVLYAERLGILRNAGYVKNLPSILDVILERPVPYDIRKLTIGARFQGTAEDWIGQTKPSDIDGFLEAPGHSTSGRKEYVALNLRAFGNPIKIGCQKGLPVYSKDENTHSCNILFLAPGSTMVRFRFHTGQDLPGHWPSVDQASEAWAQPLQVMEDALNKMIVANGEEGWTCS